MSHEHRHADRPAALRATARGRLAQGLAVITAVAALAPGTLAGPALATARPAGSPHAVSAGRAKRKANRRRHHTTPTCRRGEVLRHGRCVKRSSSAY